MHPKALEGFELTKKWYEDNPGKHPIAKFESRVAKFMHNRRSEKRDNKLSDDDIRELESIHGWVWVTPHKADKRIATSLTPIDDTFNPLCTTRQHQIEWIAGFLAGDGCIYIGSNHVQVEYAQAKKGVANLQYIQQTQGGNIIEKFEATETQQQSFSLRMDYDTSSRHLETLKDVMTHKTRQLHIGLEFPRNMRGRPESQCEQIRARRKELLRESRELKRIYDEDIDDSKLTLNFLGGFFAAEGCGTLTREGRPTISIAQKSPKMLESIRRFWGFGRVNGSRYWCTTNLDDAEIFARAMLGKSGCKDAVLRVIIDYIDEYNIESRKRSQSRMSEDRITYYRELLSSLNGINATPLLPTIPSLHRETEVVTGLPVGLSAASITGYKFMVDGDVQGRRKYVHIGPKSGVTCHEDAIRVFQEYLSELADIRMNTIRDAVHRFTRM